MWPPPMSRAATSNIPPANLPTHAMSKATPMAYPMDPHTPQSLPLAQWHPYPTSIQQPFPHPSYMYEPPMAHTSQYGPDQTMHPWNHPQYHTHHQPATPIPIMRSHPYPSTAPAQIQVPPQASSRTYRTTPPASTPPNESLTYEKVCRY